MTPFRVHDREEKTTWVIVNYHQNRETYLAYRQQDDSDDDGVLIELAIERVKGCRIIDFVVEPD